MKSVFFICAMLISGQVFAAGTCFSVSQIRNFRAQNEHELVVRVGRADYSVQVSFCSELPWAHTIGFDSFGGRVCRGDRLLIFDNFNQGQVSQTCFIQSVEKI